MQDPEIQNILSDPVMRQVGLRKIISMNIILKSQMDRLLFSIVLYFMLTITWIGAGVG